MEQQLTLLTCEGFERFKAELEHLRTRRRAEMADRIRHAVEDGGELAENNGYIDAKNEQAFVEGRIHELERILSNVQIIVKPEGPDDVVMLGSIVTVQERRRKPEQYHLVGTVEADPRAGRISNESPLGCALIGHKVGDEVVIAAPDGPRIFEIRTVE